MWSDFVIKPTGSKGVFRPRPKQLNLIPFLEIDERTYLVPGTSRLLVFDLNASLTPPKLILFGVICILPQISMNLTESSLGVRVMDKIFLEAQMLNKPLCLHHIHMLEFGVAGKRLCTAHLF
jgi:hypothetical protein